ncbi:hypothetical protein LEP1GSC038_0155 [Leptospira weilii str. 2006001855]|uniref:Uncharacterized protein n=1 Tax=Leptospira weilii str. 2006001855 TaxID=996804 RepID=M6G551_9LEPT|nr:hypothetical protein LEP1GSC038_0155 [Leptospira weilii str. 2006001855]
MEEGFSASVLVKFNFKTSNPILWFVNRIVDSKKEIEF